jgi:hypothetical protein
MFCYHAECHYAESRIIFAIMLNVIKLSVVMLSVVALIELHTQTLLCWEIESTQITNALAYYTVEFSNTVVTLG